MNPQVTESFAALDTVLLQQAQQVIGVPLPDDYVQFLLSHNGGRIAPAQFTLRWHDAGLARRFARDRVHVLFGIGPGESLDLCAQLDAYRERIPADTLPIGIDPGGNLILLGLAAPRTGHVMLWVQDQEVDWEAGEVPDFSNVGLAADTFTEFLAALREP